MYEKSFDCVAYQRKVRDELIEEAKYDINTFFKLIYEKTKESEFVKTYKERIKNNN